MTRRLSAAALLRRAIANGATIEVDTPAAQTQRAPRQEGDKLNRLARAATRGWRSIESDNSQRYRWRAPGVVTDWMSYDAATAYAAAHDPGEG